MSDHRALDWGPERIERAYRALYAAHMARAALGWDERLRESARELRVLAACYRIALESR